VSDVQRPELPADSTADDIHTTDVDGNAIPSAETLEANSLPAIYTRSPRLVRVVATAGGIGALVGFVLGAALPAGLMWGRLTAGLVLAVAGALAGSLIAGVVVASNEARSAKHVSGRKNEVIAEWLATHPDSPYYEADPDTHPDTNGKPA
jgi:hypothetical protein